MDASNYNEALNTALDDLTTNQSKIANRKPKIELGFLLTILITLFAVAPLLTHRGLPNTADGPAHLMRQVELNEAWQTGIYYPRWAPDLALGHGMPLFSYAPPLLYQTTQLLHLTGLPLDTAMKGSVILAMLLYSAAMYLYTRALFGPQAALLSAAVYLLAPYRLREAYIQGNYGQFWGLAFYPLIFWAFHQLIVTRRRHYAVVGALALAGLLLSHNISAMLFAPLFGLYLLLLFWLYRPRPFTWRNLIRKSPWPVVGLALALGLGLSAFFWLPAFAEKDLIRLAGITSGFFDFRHNFISLTELLALPRPLDLSAVNPYFPLNLGVAQIMFVLLTIGILAVFRPFAHSPIRSFAHSSFILHSFGKLRTGSSSFILFFIAAFAGYAFMTVPYSVWLWENLPLIALTEFPWRMLGPAIFCAAVVAGAGIYLLQQLNPKVAFTALIIGLIFTVAVNLVYLVPEQFIPWGTPTPADAVAYETHTGAIGTTSTGEFLPRWVEQYPAPETLGPDYEAGRLPAKIDPAELPPGAYAKTTSYTAQETRIAVDSPVPFEATLRTLYWPEWKIVLVDSAGEVIKTYTDNEIEITQPNGLLRVTLPAGNYELVLQRAPTPIRRVAGFIFGASLVILAGLVLPASRRLPLLNPPHGLPPSNSPHREENRPTSPPLGGIDEKRFLHQGGLSAEHFSKQQALVLSLVISVGLVLSVALAKQFQVRSPLNVVYGVEQALQIDFADQIRLLGVDPPPKVARPGDEIAPVVYWRALQYLDSDYAVFLHLDALDGVTIATTDQAHPSNISTSSWHPGLYLRNPLKLTIPANAPPIRYSLRVGLYNSQSGERLLRANNQGNSYEIGHIWLESTQPLHINGSPAARFGDSIRLLDTNYDPARQSITLIWQTSSPLPQDYSIFVHLLDESGNIIGQVDGVPYQNQYPTSAWRPGQTIEDTRILSDVISAGNQPAQFAVGVYNPATGERLIAVDGNGNMLADNALVIGR